MKKITATELKSILDQHQLWIETNRMQGTRAILTGADLSDAFLGGAELEGAELEGANLTGANLTGVNLSDADLTDADLTDADLTGASLWGTNLTRANLTGTILEKKAEKKENVSVNSSFGEELQMLLDKHGVKLAAAIQLELK